MEVVDDDERDAVLAVGRQPDCGIVVMLFAGRVISGVVPSGPWKARVASASVWR